MALALKGKSAIVTGAAAGIGRALVREFLKEGCRVAAVDRDQAALDGLLEEAELMGFALHALRLDVGDRTQLRLTLDAYCSRHGVPEVFVNNAGVARVGGFAATSLETWDETLRVNLSGLLYGTHFALAKMEEAGRGVVVNMASMAGHLPGAYLAAYSASKFGVVGLTRALQEELALSGSPVKLCLVCPGFVDTAIMSQEKAPFPWYLRWAVASPAQTAKAVVAGIKAERSEIYPDWGGRMMKRFHRVAPGLAARGGRLLLAKSISQLLGREPIRL